MSTDPDQIREDIERTRAELSSDVDALTEKVSPTQAAQRQAERVRSAATGLKDRFMGAVGDTADAARGTAASRTERIGSAASSIGDKASDLPQATASKTRGNPLAAGLIAFGVGWLISSAVPSTRQEQRLAQSAKDQAAPLVDEAKDAAQSVAENLREPAQDAATAVKDRAAEAGSTLRDEGRDAASALRSQASDATENVKGAHAANDGEQAF